MGSVSTFVVVSSPNLFASPFNQVRHFLSLIADENGYHWQNSSLFVYAHSRYICHED